MDCFAALAMTDQYDGNVLNATMGFKPTVAMGTVNVPLGFSGG